MNTEVINSENQVLDWRDQQAWDAAVSIYAQSVVSIETIDSLTKRGIRGCWSDDMSWLADPETYEDFFDCFTAHYSHIKCFHGARPVDVGSYYQLGLVGQNQERVEQQFMVLFQDFPVELLIKAVAEHDYRGKSERGRVYTVCNDRELVDRSGHYLIHGSEYMLALAATLTQLAPSGADLRLRLRQSGIPTVFEMDVPLHAVPNPQLHSLVQTVVASWFQRRLFPNEHHSYDMGFSFEQDLLPSWIVNHYHPKVIRDPHFGGSNYYPDISSYDHC